MFNNQSLYDSSLAVFMFKIYHGYHPPVICNMFTKNPNQNNRQKHHYKIPRATCKSFETSLFVQGPKIFNRFIDYVQINCSVYTYKKHINPHILLSQT